MNATEGVSKKLKSKPSGAFTIFQETNRYLQNSESLISTEV